MRDRLLKQASREYGELPRLLLLLPAGVLFVVLLPWALIHFGRLLDRVLHWSAPRAAPANAAVGGLMVAGGGLLALWTIYAQFTLGRGTPVPVMATQKLIVRPPYSYCRNPMALGTIVLYGGVSVAAGSPGAALLVLPGAAALLAYIRFIEEREMVARFGEEYLAYRREVPFLIPRILPR